MNFAHDTQINESQMICLLALAGIKSFGVSRIMTNRRHLQFRAERAWRFQEVNIPIDEGGTVSLGYVITVITLMAEAFGKAKALPQEERSFVADFAREIVFRMNPGMVQPVSSQDHKWISERTTPEFWDRLEAYIKRTDIITPPQP